MTIEAQEDVDVRGELLKLFLTVLGTISLLVSFSLYFLGNLRTHLLNLGACGLSSFLLFAYAFSSTSLLFQRPRNFRKYSGDIQQVLTYLKSEKRFEEAVRISVDLDRVLWVSGRWADRIEAGHIVATFGKPEEQLAALVDMLGWTYAATGRYAEAKESLQKGCEQAKRDGNWYYAAKGFRHLAGVEYLQKSWNAASQLLVEARAYADRISDEKSRNEMIAGIFYGEAEIMHGQGNLEKALEANARASAIYRELADDPRDLKCITQRGFIYCERYGQLKHQSDLGSAYSAFREAGIKAETFRRPEQLAESFEGSGDLKGIEGDSAGGRAYLKKAAIIYRRIGSREKTNRVRDKLKSLPLYSRRLVR